MSLKETSRASRECWDFDPESWVSLGLGYPRRVEGNNIITRKRLDIQRKLIWSFAGLVRALHRTAWISKENWQGFQKTCRVKLSRDDHPVGCWQMSDTRSIEILPRRLSRWDHFLLKSSRLKSVPRSSTLSSVPTQWLWFENSGWVWRFLVWVISGQVNTRWSDVINLVHEKSM